MEHMSASCSDDERFATWPLLLETYSVLMDILERELEPVGRLPLTWYDVLVQLSKTPEGRMPMKDLAQSLLLSRSGVTRLIDRMESAGLIERVACAYDRRMIFAAVTPRGRAMFRKAAPVHMRGIREHFTRHLTDSEVRSIRSALGKVLSAARADAQSRRAG